MNNVGPEHGVARVFNHAVFRRRALMTLPAIGGFAAGCMAGAILDLHCGLWALIFPASTAGLAVLLGILWSTRMA